MPNAKHKFICEKELLSNIADETNLNSWTGVTISSSLGTHKRGVATDGDGVAVYD